MDAADFQLTQRFMQDGDMPRLAAVADGSCFSLLRSVVPPQTAPGWTSITTGLNPGKHGIYYFYNFSTSPIAITNSTDTSAPRVWDYVEGDGGRSVVVNVPITYPVHEMSGAIVSGIPPWYIDERSVYPAGLWARLEKSGYEIDTPLSRGLEKQPELLAAKLLATEERRVTLFLDLLKEQEWSFGMVVLTALDRLQHKALGKGDREAEAVKTGYRGVDALVGRIIDALGKETNFLVVSDHGFNARPIAFYPNSWLYANGFLRRKSSAPYRLSRFAHDIFDGRFLWVPQRFTKRFQGGKTVVRTIDAVDLEASRAFVPGTDGVMVVRSKEDEAVIASGLSGIKDDSGKEVCEVYTRDQVYKGDKLGAAPQLLIVPRDDVNIKTDPFSESVLSMSGDFAKANHGPKGVFFALGPDIKGSKTSEVSLEDVAPTALVLMGIRPPETMDGRCVEEIMAEVRPPQALRTVRLRDEDRAYAFTEKEEKLVMDNLKRLGYT